MPKAEPDISFERRRCRRDPKSLLHPGEYNMHALELVVMLTTSRGLEVTAQACRKRTIDKMHDLFNFEISTSSV